jgi:Ring finger domain
MAIVLYSINSPFCALTPSFMGTLQYNTLYSMATVASAIMFENLLKQSQAALAMISPSATGTTTQLVPSGTPSGSSGSGGGLGASPTTTVAMIILYSITGLVTALFLIIIATGAIRAHRHPERYGPRMTGPLGRQRQSRAKGLARAVLESIPIVKFGEKDDKQPRGDMELGVDQHQPTLTGGDGAADVTGVGNQRSGPGDSVRDGEPQNASPRVDEGSAIASANPTATGDGDQIQPSVEAPLTSNDEGLSCSICTEDFVKGEDIRVLPCNHKYHPDCVDPWLLNVSGTCPLWLVLPIFFLTSGLPFVVVRTNVEYAAALT